MKTKRTGKILSLLLAMSMMFTMLPMAAFAETGDVDSGVPLGVRKTITAFAELDTAVSAQSVEAGTVKEKLALPDELAVTATDSEAQEETIETTVSVSDWTSEPSYDGNSEGVYTFTPSLAPSEGLTVTEGVYAPQITVVVEEKTTPQARDGISPMSGGTVTGSLSIGGDLAASDLTADSNGSSGGITWAWDAATATLTLENNGTTTYPLGAIVFDTAGDVTIAVPSDKSADVAAIAHMNMDAGKLTINGGGTLNVLNNETNTVTIETKSDLEIDNVTVNAMSTQMWGDGVYVNGSFTMNSATLNISATGVSSFGITSVGNINISGYMLNVTSTGVGINARGDILVNGGTVDVKCTGEDRAIEANGVVLVSGGSVKAKGGGNWDAIYSGGVTVSGGTLTTGERGAAGDISGPYLTVDNAAATVTINGGIYNSSDDCNLNVSAGTVTVTGLVAGGLTVSDGTVTVVGEVRGSTNLTGGTVWVEGKKLWPVESTYTATLNIRYNGAVNSADTTGYTLKLSSNEAITFDMVGTGATRTASVPNGTWKVHEELSDKYTGVNIRISDSDANAQLDWYQMIYSTSSQGTATGGKIDLTINDESGFGCNASGGWDVIKGSKLIFAASGEGTTSYTYEWSGTNSGNSIRGTGNTYTIDFLQGRVNITCTITGSDTTLPIEITGFEAIPDENVGKAGSSICANVSEVINLLRAIHPYANAMHSGNQTALCLITGWEDTDGYNPNKAGSYTFTADVAILPGFANSAGHKVTVEVVVAPSDAPTITITKHPQNVTVTQGKINEILTAEAVASNGKPVHYQWRRFIGGIGSDNTQPLLGETSNTFTIPTGLTAGTYRYLCVFNTDGTDYVDSNTAIVTVKSPSSDGSGGGSGGYSGGNGGSGVVVTPPGPDAPNAPTQGSVNIHGTVDNNGNITANITNQTVSDAIDKALAQEAKKNGTEQNSITLVLNISAGNQPINNLTVNLSKAVQDIIIAKAIANIVIAVNGSDITIGMDLAALREMNRQAGGNINLTATRMNNATLAGNARAAIGNRPVFDLKANYGNGRTVQNFGAGNVSVTIPYTLGTNENAGNIQAVYVDANGKVQWLISSVYDSVNGVLRFSTNHFSTYGVGYKQDAPSFTDIGSHWAKEDIVFVANRELLSGTSSTTFSPNTAMTRGMFVTALGRLANADVSGYKKSSFTDVKNDAYYMVYIEWANKNNIVKGIGDGKFSPDLSITREQMAVMMQSYAQAIGFTLPKVHGENTFVDNANISAYAKDAVKQMQMAGVISGENGNIFDPQGTATRAEASTVLRHFVELAISSDTAQGWTMNDSGQWMYYENGKPVTGKKNIDGSTYTFDKYGVTADVPKNLKYTTYTVQKDDSFWLIAHKLGCTMSELERLNNKSRFDLIHPGDVLKVPEKLTGSAIAQHRKAG